INEIGAEKWAAICSDSTAITKNSCREITAHIPTMLDFNDVCHHQHNTIKDVMKLECFGWMISLLKVIVKHFSKSMISIAHLHKECHVEGDDHTVNSLQKISKTHFGTHWPAAVSLQQCLTNIKTLVENKIVKFKVQVWYTMFGCDLETYITTVGPFICSLWSLEVSHANALDIFIFWLAIGASLKDLVKKGDGARSNVPLSLMYDVIAIYDCHWKELFQNDVYFTAFALDPHMPATPIDSQCPKLINTQLQVTPYLILSSSLWSLLQPLPYLHRSSLHPKIWNILGKWLSIHCHILVPIAV
ncbi:hypothetical protein EDC04DRAFT_2562532, partial [Pisolithus marmoratus]